jgi:hypothetical protein
MKPGAGPYRWAWEALEARLLWLYGPERTYRILDATDAATKADLKAWRALGSFKP